MRRKDRGKFVRAQSAPADIYQGAHNVSNHMAQERPGLDSIHEKIALATDDTAHHCAPRCSFHGVRSLKRRKIVMSDEQGRGGIH